MKLLTIDHLGSFGRVNANIDSKQWQPFLALSLITDLRPIVSAEMINDIEALPIDGSDRPQLRNFHSSFIVPFLAKAVEIRLLAQHGANWGREGLVQFVDSQNTSSPISDAMRSTMLKQCRSDLSVFQTYLKNEFAAIGQTLDGVKYTVQDGLNSPEIVASTIQPIGNGRKSKANRYE
jgi:hypothetical protein